MGFGGYKIDNNGTNKMAIDGRQVVDVKETGTLTSRLESLGASAESNFYDHMKTVSIPEWIVSTEDPTQNKVIPWY